VRSGPTWEPNASQCRRNLNAIRSDLTLLWTLHSPRGGGILSPVDLSGRQVRLNPRTRSNHRSPRPARAIAGRWLVRSETNRRAVEGVEPTWESNRPVFSSRQLPRPSCRPRTEGGRDFEQAPQALSAVCGHCRFKGVPYADRAGAEEGVRCRRRPVQERRPAQAAWNDDVREPPRRAERPGMQPHHSGNASAARGRKDRQFALTGASVDSRLGAVR
jgi:hypothetical protein